ncbi:MAG: tRNA (adenosine(37)-N6)-threonylcarbamoyltransferase complex dimerization subunit type 1 TsaB [Deltaproteobacteria bacterium]|nr:tRNA (adenosine(37)-N6)-threonylcarbamoyltransferase complex dimerization subunit type 1 TsaB [Deltaproteobacteria bacterium]
MLILALETSTRTGGVALLEGLPGGLRIIGESLLHLPSSHSTRLMPAIDHLLRQASRSIREVGGIALALGPGSFTGLRIGVATAKGLAYARRIPVAGVPTLDGLAQNARFAPGLVCPVLDARKKEVYAALYRGNGEGDLHKEGGDWVLGPEELCGRIRERTWFLGDGVEVYGEVFRRQLGSLARFAPAEHSLPRAVHVGCLSWPRFQAGQVLDLFSFTPTYLRRSEAELLYEKRMAGERPPEEAS